MISYCFIFWSFVCVFVFLLFYERNIYIFCIIWKCCSATDTNSYFIHFCLLHWNFHKQQREVYIMCYSGWNNRSLWKSILWKVLAHASRSNVYFPYVRDDDFSAVFSIKCMKIIFPCMWKAFFIPHCPFLMENISTLENDSLISGLLLSHCGRTVEKLFSIFFNR